MTQGEVINKVSMECALALGELDHLQTIRTYIQMALTIGIDHFRKEMEEIVVLDVHGVECGRYKSVMDAERKLGIGGPRIHHVLSGNNHTAGGYMFIRTKDYELVPREPPTYKLPIIPLS